MFLSFPEVNYILRRPSSFLCFLHHRIAGLEKLVNVVFPLIDVPEHQPLIRQLTGKPDWSSRRTVTCCPLVVSEMQHSRRSQSCSQTTRANLTTHIRMKQIILENGLISNDLVDK